jgi:hypothetical protein
MSMFILSLLNWFRKKYGLRKTKCLICNVYFDFYKFYWAVYNSTEQFSAISWNIYSGLHVKRHLICQILAKLQAGPNISL